MHHAVGLVDHCSIQDYAFRSCSRPGPSYQQPQRSPATDGLASLPPVRMYVRIRASRFRVLDALAHIVRRVSHQDPSPGLDRQLFVSRRITQTYSGASPQSPDHILFRWEGWNRWNPHGVGLRQVERSQFGGTISVQPARQLIDCHHQPSARGCGWCGRNRPLHRT